MDLIDAAVNSYNRYMVGLVGFGRALACRNVAEVSLGAASFEYAGVADPKPTNLDRLMCRLVTLFLAIS